MHIRDLKSGDVDTLLELLRLSFGSELPGREITSDPSFLAENNLGLWEDDRLVSSVQVFDRTMLIDGQPASVGGIGNVATLPDARGKGYASRLLRQVVEHMREKGYVLSQLWGREDFYSRFGWRTARMGSLDCDVTGVPETESNLTVEKLTTGVQVRRCAQIHSDFTATLTGPLVRTVRYWKEYLLRLHGEEEPGYFTVRGTGEIDGYFALLNQPEGLYVRELGWLGEPADIGVRIVQHIVGLAQEMEFRRVIFQCNTPAVRKVVALHVPLPRAILDPYGMVMLLDARRLGVAGVNTTQDLVKRLEQAPWVFWRNDAY